MSGAGSRPLSVVQVVSTDAFAGVERYMCQVSNGLASRGHHVAVVGGEPERMRSELDEGVEHHPASTVLETARVLAGRRRVDVVHAHMTAAEGAAWLARPRQRAPIVATRHFPGGRGSSPVARSLARLTSRPIARDIAISKFVAAGLPGPSVLLYNGVPDRPQAALVAPTVVILQRLSAEKCPELGLRAWSASGLGRQGWRLVVAGSGERRPSLVELAGQLGVDDSVDFVGQVTDTDALLAGASIVLATAPAEPFGLSVVEAMAHGVPVVGAGGGGHLETIGDVGELFPPGDPEAASAALVMLARDPDLRQRTGQRLRARQRELFTLGRHLDRLEHLYREVGEEHRRR